jgi:hypothetical protein
MVWIQLAHPTIQWLCFTNVALCLWVLWKQGRFRSSETIEYPCRPLPIVSKLWTINSNYWIELRRQLHWYATTFLDTTYIALMTLTSFMEQSWQLFSSSRIQNRKVHYHIHRHSKHCQFYKMVIWPPPCAIACLNINHHIVCCSIIIIYLFKLQIGGSVLQ